MLACDLALQFDVDDDARNCAFWHTSPKCISTESVRRSNYFCSAFKLGARIAADGGSNTNEPLRRVTISRMNHRRLYKFLVVAVDKSLASEWRFVRFIRWPLFH